MRQVAEGDDGHQYCNRQPSRDRISSARQRVLPDLCKAFLNVFCWHHNSQGVHHAGKIGKAVLD